MVQQQATMNEILSKVDYCEKKVKSQVEQQGSLSHRLETQSKTTKEDINKLNQTNKKLFESFIDQANQLDAKYDLMASKVTGQSEYFDSTKSKFSECLETIQMLEKKVTNQDLASENQIRLVREEIDIIQSRVNSKDQKGSDMLDQVIDIEQKVVQAQKNVKAIDNSILKKVDEIKRYCELVLPAEQSRLMFEQL